MDNRVFYKMLLELNSLDDLPIKNGDYEIAREEEKFLFFHKAKVEYLLNKHCLKWAIEEFEKSLRLSSRIAFKFVFDIKEYEEVYIKVCDLWLILTREGNTFDCLVQGEYENSYLFEIQLTDQQIEQFKKDRFAFSDYLRKEIM